MTFLGNKPQAKKVTFGPDAFSIYLSDGRILSVPLAYFPRLLNANSRQLKNYELSGGGTGIHWDDLDEDISVEGLLIGRGDQTQHPLPSNKTA